MKYRFLLLASTAVLLGSAAQAQSMDTFLQTPAMVASKLAVRGDMNFIAVPEMRAVRKNDILAVQADLFNNDRRDRVVFYRFRWLDANGTQVGDGESWKQLSLMGQAQQTVKSVGPMASATDFRLEMNVSFPQ